MPKRPLVALVKPFARRQVEAGLHGIGIRQKNLALQILANP